MHLAYGFIEFLYWHIAPCLSGEQCVTFVQIAAHERDFCELNGPLGR